MIENMSYTPFKHYEMVMKWMYFIKYIVLVAINGTSYFRDVSYYEENCKPCLLQQ